MRQTAGRLARFPRRLRLLKGRGRVPAEVVKFTAGETGRVGLHVGGGVAVITVRRPGKMNALNEEMWAALLKAVRQASRDERVRVLVIRGEGDHFSTGADLKELGRVGLPQAEDVFHRMEECVAAIEESPLPTLACIRGYALGTGLELALACDLRIASDKASFLQAFVNIGLVPDGGSSLLVPERVGLARAASVHRRLDPANDAAATVGDEVAGRAAQVVGDCAHGREPIPGVSGNSPARRKEFVKHRPSRTLLVR